MEKNNGKHAVGEVIFAEAQHIGYGQQRQTLEDRCTAQKITTKDGKTLTVGLVADGIGGSNAGEIASQLVVDTVVETIANTANGDIGALLGYALKKSHQAVVQAARANPALNAMGTTATITAVFEGHLYLAHVGDSRAYLVREGNITQLTLDHTWGNEKIRTGQLSIDQVEKHPRKEELARYVGMHGNFDVDEGVRVNGADDPASSELSVGGLELLPGDVVLVCSDGLIKERPNSNFHFVEPNEIVNTLHRNNPDDAANTLLSLALGRQVDDNVSVVIMEAPGKKKKFTSAGSGLPLWGWIGGGLILLVLLLLGISALAGLDGKGEDKPQVNQPAGQVIELSEDLIMDAAEVVAYTGGIPKIEMVSGGGLTELSVGQKLPIGPGVKLVTFTGNSVHLKLSNGDELFVGENSTIYLNDIAHEQRSGSKNLFLVQKGMFIIQASEAFVGLPDGTMPYQAELTNGEMFGVMYGSNGDFIVDCLQGSCKVDGIGNPIVLSSGGQAGYKANKGFQGEIDHAVWAALPGIVLPQPTATPTLTPTATPTITPTPTLKPTLIYIEPTSPPPSNSGGSGGGNNNPPPPPEPTKDPGGE